MESKEKEETNKIEEPQENKEIKENNEIIETQEKNEIKETKKEDNVENKINKSKEMKTIEAPPSIGGNKIKFEDEEFYYSITELEGKDGINIKLSEVKQEKNIYFQYEASNEKLIQEIDFLYSFKDLEQKINILYQLFRDDKVTITKKEDKYFMELEFVILNIGKKYELELEKFEIYEPTKEELINSFKDLNDKFNELKNEINDIKKNTNKTFGECSDKNMINQNNIDLNLILDELEKKINIKEKIKEALKEKDIQDMIFSELEKRISNNKSKSEIIEENGNIKNDNFNLIENKKEDVDFENKILEKLKLSVDELINEKLKIQEEKEKINKENLEKIEGEINNKINEINKTINNENWINKNNNYITAKILVNKDNVGKNIRILRQNKTYKNLYNFEYDDFIVSLSDEIIPVNYNNVNGNFNYSGSGDYTTQSRVYYLVADYEFCINFEKEGEYTIKILFKKKLTSLYSLFYECKSIKEIDLSHFDCSEVKSCGYMFYGCISLSKINFGKLDFNLSNYFGYMFYNCYELEELDVSNFITKKSTNFDYMFYGCKKLKNIDVSKFNSSNCKTIQYMFYQCENIKLIDMISWDMSNINNINYLFNGCKNLIKIKMSSNFKDIENINMQYVFDGIPKEGDYVHKIGIKCKPLTKMLPDNWEIDKE